VRELETDKRRHNRRWLNQMRLTSPVSGRVTDITLAGMGIETREPLPVLKRRKFSFGLAKNQLEYQGEIRWCRFVDSIPLPNGERSAVYRAGIAFTEYQILRPRSDSRRTPLG